MDKPLHILGRYRWPLVMLLTLIIGYSIYYAVTTYMKATSPITTQEAIKHLSVLTLVSFAVSFLITTEYVLRISLSLLSSIAIGGLVSVITYFATSYFATAISDTELHGYSIAAGIISLLLAWYIIYQLLRRSKYIGQRCPECKMRGTIMDTEVDRNWSGSRRDSDGNTYSKYDVTVEHCCRNCDYSWYTGYTISSK